MALHVGDTRPLFKATLFENGYPVNLTDATIEIHIRKPSGSVVTLAGTATAPADGRVEGAAWGSTLDSVGVYLAEVQVTFSDSSIQTFGPDTFEVISQIA